MEQARKNYLKSCLNFYNSKTTQELQMMVLNKMISEENKTLITNIIIERKQLKIF